MALKCMMSVDLG